MQTFTYEANDSKVQYETYEWDNTWIEHANKPDARRILYIGDSISCGIRQIATKLTEAEFLFDGYGSSKGVDNPYLFESIRLFAKQEGSREAILFNNGLHGWHLEDETEYRNCFDKTVAFLLQEFPGTPVLPVLTTCLANEERNERVLVRNQIALEIAEKYQLTVIDLYATSFENKQFLKEDGVHFLEDGYHALAEKIVSDVRKIID